MDMLKSLSQSPKSLTEQVAEQIKQLILEQQLKAGDKLPNEFEMAKQLSVGRGTIREAVKLLVAQNIVEIKRGCGTYVCENPGVADDPLGISFMQDKRQLALDMCEMRLIIEPEIARLAAKRADDEHIRRLWELEKEMAELIRTRQDYGELDVKLHEQLAACTGNRIMEQIMPVIQNSIMLFIKVTDAKLADYTLKEHRAIVEAVAAHDVQKAGEAMVAHVGRNQKLIKEITIEAEKMEDVSC